MKCRQALTDVTRKSWKHRCLDLVWGAFNVRTMHCQNTVSSDGELRHEGSDVDRPELLCELLGKHKMSLCCISEHRWRGEGTLQCGDFLYVFSGLPAEAPKAMQGVAILMNSEMQLTWRRAGSSCDSHGGRLIHVKLELQRRIVHVISVYAPTFNTEATEKDDFYDSLRGMLGNVKTGEGVVVMGDFNARVGFRAHSSMSGEHDIGASDSVGPFGMGHLNDNGERLLGLCEGSPVGLLKVAGIFFRHAHYGSWMHARTKQWQHIDHVLAPIRTMRMVLDVKTMPGIGFDTGHRLIRMRFRVPPRAWTGCTRKSQAYAQSQRIPKLQVCGLGPVETDNINQKLHASAQEGLLDECEFWSYGLRRFAEEQVGLPPVIKRPQWQLDNTARLGELSRMRLAAFEAYVNGGSKEAYRTTCKSARREIRSIMNCWWRNKAALIQEQVDNKEPHAVYAGHELKDVIFHRRRRPNKLRNEKGQFLLTKPDRLQRWYEYFKDLLNVHGHCKESNFDFFAQGSGVV